MILHRGLGLPMLIIYPLLVGDHSARLKNMQSLWLDRSRGYATKRRKRPLERPWCKASVCCQCNKEASPIIYITLEVQTSDGRRQYEKHTVHFLECKEAHTNDGDLFMREFLKSDKPGLYLVCQLKPGSMHNWEHLVSLFNTKFFCGEAKFNSLSWLDTPISMAGPGCISKKIF